MPTSISNAIPAPKPKVDNTPTQNQSWNLRDLKGTREDLVEQIVAATFVPVACKAMLVEQVQELKHPGKLFRLDCHAFCVESERGLTLTGHWNLASI